MEKEMGSIARILYRFSSRGLFWPALFGWVFGLCVFHFNMYVNGIIGMLIGYLLIMPIIGMIAPITFAIMLIIASVVGLNSSDPFWGIIAVVLLAIHLLRVIANFILIRKYPMQTKMLDAEYQNR